MLMSADNCWAGSLRITNDCITRFLTGKALYGCEIALLGSGLVYPGLPFTLGLSSMGAYCQV